MPLVFFILAVPIALLHISLPLPRQYSEKCLKTHTVPEMLEVQPKEWFLEPSDALMHDHLQLLLLWKDLLEPSHSAVI